MSLKGAPEADNSASADLLGGSYGVVVRLDDDQHSNSGPTVDRLGGAHRAPGRIAQRVDAVVRVGREELLDTAHRIGQDVAAVALRLAEGIERQAGDVRSPTLGIESVQLTFGLALKAGMQAFFTAEADTAVEVSVTLTRSPRVPGAS